MPRKRSASTFSPDAVPTTDQRVRYPAPPKPKYVNVYLNEQDCEWLESNYATANDYFTDFVDTLPTTYGISLYQDSTSGKWNAILSCNDDFDPNNGCKLSVRVSSAVDALYALAYAHDVKFEGKWGNGTGSAASRWG